MNWTRVVESQVNRREPSRFEFVLDVACTEYAGGERHEGVQDDETRCSGHSICTERA